MYTRFFCKKGNEFSYIEIKRNGGVTTFQNELVGFSTHLVFSMAIWFTLMFIIAIIA